MHRHELIPRLERTPMFAQFGRDDISALIDYMSVLKVAKGATIFREGERNAHMCLLLEGKLEVHKDSGQGANKKIADIIAGKPIGEMSVIDGMPYSATVVAAQDSTLVLLSRDNLMRICEERARIGNRLLWQISTMVSLRLRQTTGKLVDHL
jgi:CRP/FNR family transcriptional regulator, cyclic AMP receptor protein